MTKLQFVQIKNQNKFQSEKIALFFKSAPPPPPPLFPIIIHHSSYTFWQFLKDLNHLNFLFCTAIDICRHLNVPKREHIPYRCTHQLCSYGAHRLLKKRGILVGLPMNRCVWICLRTDKGIIRWTKIWRNYFWNWIYA